MILSGEWSCGAKRASAAGEEQNGSRPQRWGATAAARVDAHRRAGGNGLGANLLEEQLLVELLDHHDGLPTLDQLLELPQHLAGLDRDHLERHLRQEKQGARVTSRRRHDESGCCHGGRPRKGTSDGNDVSGVHCQAEAATEATPCQDASVASPQGGAHVVVRLGQHEQHDAWRDLDLVNPGVGDVVEHLARLGHRPHLVLTRLGAEGEHLLVHVVKLNEPGALEQLRCEELRRLAGTPAS
eukprot:scaffold16092_cov127-Isochrysis_galbana.AAC.12